MMKIALNVNNGGSALKINNDVKLVNVSRKVGWKIWNGIAQMLWMNTIGWIAPLDGHHKEHLYIISLVDLTLFPRLAINLIHFSVFHREQFNKDFRVSISVRSVMEISIVREDKMNEIPSNIALNRRRRCLDIISCVHRRTRVFLSIFIVGQMIIDAPIDPMMNFGVTANDDLRVVSIRMISFVLMVNVSKEVDAMENSSVPSMKMNTCVIMTVHGMDYSFIIVNSNDSLEEDDPRFFICIDIHPMWTLQNSIHNLHRWFLSRHLPCLPIGVIEVSVLCRRRIIQRFFVFVLLNIMETNVNFILIVFPLFFIWIFLH
jgi:hypothetical protein